MRTLPMLARLLWKEFRQGWAILALGLAISPAAIHLTRSGLQIFQLKISIIALFVLLLAVAVWSATLAAGQRARQSYAAAHFALHPSWSTATTFLCQGGIIVLIALNYGYWASSLLELPNDMSPAAALLSFHALNLLYFWGIFAIGFLVSSAFSPLAGMAAGILWMLGNLNAFAVLSYPSILVRYPFTESEWYLHYFAYGALAAVAAFGILHTSARPAPRWRAVAACSVLGVVIIGYPLYMMFSHSGGTIARTGTPNRLSSPDGSLAVEVLQTSSARDCDLRFIDYHSGMAVERRFPVTVKPIGFAGRTSAILAAQQPRETRITILRWELENNTTIPVLSFPARRGALNQVLYYAARKESASYYSLFAASVADGRYGILSVPAYYGGTESQIFDIWGVDLLQRRALLLISTPSYWDLRVGWAGNTAILTSPYHDPVKITFPSGTVEPLSLPIPTEAR